MYAEISEISRLKNKNWIRFAIYIFDEEGQRLFGFSGNRISVNPNTQNLNVFPVSTTIKGKSNYRIGFIHFSTWAFIAQAVREAIEESEDDPEKLITIRKRLSL